MSPIEAEDFPAYQAGKEPYAFNQLLRKFNADGSQYLQNIRQPFRQAPASVTELPRPLLPEQSPYYSQQPVVASYFEERQPSSSLEYYQRTYQQTLTGIPNLPAISQSFPVHPYASTEQGAYYPQDTPAYMYLMNQPALDSRHFLRSDAEQETPSGQQAPPNDNIINALAETREIMSWSPLMMVNRIYPFIPSTHITRDWNKASLWRRDTGNVWELDPSFVRHSFFAAPFSCLEAETCKCFSRGNRWDFLTGRLENSSCQYRSYKCKQIG